MTEGARPPARSAPLEPDPMLGRLLAGRYRIDALVARGGMARVYRARDGRLERDVAVKVLAPPYSDDPTFTERFLGEARASGSLSHPSLVHVYDSGSDGPAHFIVMELLDRHRTLRDVLNERGSLPVGEALRIGRELLEGLHVVHDRGLVHCDVKAANVMLGPGPAKLIDFGIAQPPHDGGVGGDTSIGTLQSMSPEQLSGAALTPASDLFSLGVVLYEAITGRVPYPGSTPEEVAAAHAAGQVAPPSAIVDGLPERLDGVLLQVLRRDPAARFLSARAMSTALAAVAGSDLDRRTEGDDETRVVRGPAPPPARTPAEQPSSRIPAGFPEPDARRSSGYVPPAVPNRSNPPPRPPASGSGRSPRPASGGPSRRPQPRRRRNYAGLIGTLAILAAAALVVVLLVVPLLRSPGAADSSPEASTAPGGASPSTAVAQDVVPDVVGQSTAEAIELANQAGLNWTVRCNENPEQPEGIIDQEPPAGTEVAPGSAFTMYSARISDCR